MKHIQMPDIASVLKAEIARIARKEVKAELESLRKTLTSQRRELLTMKKRLLDAESQLRKASKKAAAASVDSAQTGDKTDTGFKFFAKGLASNRQRLGLSQEEYGRLVGVSGPAIYSWETGKSRPRQGKLAAIAALRGIGKREVAKRLAALSQAA